MEWGGLVCFKMGRHGWSRKFHLRAELSGGSGRLENKHTDTYFRLCRLLGWHPASSLHLRAEILVSHGDTPLV